MTNHGGTQPDQRRSRGDTLPDGFWVTVLGTATPYPRPGQPCSGYLLRTATTNIWVDAGSGTMAELQRHIRLEELDAIWVSHLHADHCSDLLAVYQWLANAAEPLPPVAAFGPTGWAKRMEAFLPSVRPGMLDHFLEVHELEDQSAAVIKDLILTSRSVCHSIPTFGLRAESDGRVLAYSGDSGPCDSLTELADDADLFICESGTTQATPGPVAYHCTPEDAGRIASASGANRLLLTHLAPGLSSADAVHRAREAHGGSIALAEVGSSLLV
jgi:ribonuclease BN (tRNA processing enzyme)